MMLRKILTLSVIAALAGCAVGPDYKRPTVDVSDHFGDAPEGWKTAEPSETASRGEWWKAFGDSQLDSLMDQLNANNQTVAAALANYRQARATAEGARAGFFPTLGASVGDTRAKSAAAPTPPSTGTAYKVANSKSVALDASWEPDLWGAVRRQVEAGDASSQQSAANLALARLSAQAELVQDYMQFYVVDREYHLTDETVKAFQKTLQITRNQLSVGLVTPVDVAQAESQVKSTEAQLVDYDLSRRQLQHAISILVGKSPTSFSLTAPTADPALPEVPAALPSSLLERRPDIAAAERGAVAANAQIGVAKAAYFPALTLSAQGGNSGLSFSDVVGAPLRTWSIGASLAETLFDGGARSARVDAARAAYDAAVAQYRQTVLAGLQEVEDNLAATRLLKDEADRQAEAVDAAKKAETLSINEYKAGTVDFTAVVTAQATRHQAEIAALQIQGRRYTACATLIKALGGGWDGNLSPEVASAK